ncbi:ATP-binding protein [Rubricoccus marinus]|uniref:Schlafen AlbA-2 domain-containing protein n=1 Tax=Rubricoccus marinus TaxID=716817 RepID=A0A259TU22_9BACT|nr:ATP-binding protein [Rubricoccus marinus]OZC01190.1 hypothetical protein BSZ36_18205 [Rubricoccus marinus]
MTNIDQIIAQGEGPSIEFVNAFADPARVAAHVAALLNSGGGYILVGVDELGRPSGDVDAEASATTLQSYLARHITPATLVDVGVDETPDGLHVVTIVVPGGKDGPFVANERVYIRTGSETRPATGDELQALLQRTVAATERWERRPAPTLNDDDLDLDEIRRTVRSAADLQRANLPSVDGEDPERTLAALGMATRGALTNAADVCFGRDPAIRHPQVRVRAFAYESDRAGDFVDHQTFSGPIVQVIERAAAFIRERAPLSAEFEPDNLRRTNRTSYPTYVVREGLVNALAHRDYAASSSGVTVEVYPARVEIWNAGRLPEGWKPKTLFTPHPSLPTNPDIVHVLYLRDLMERIGRGTLKMIQTCREEGLPVPLWESGSHGVRLTLFSRASARAPQADLNDRQRALLDRLTTGDQVTLGEYHSEFADDLTERTARRDLAELTRIDLLRQEGRGRGSRYIRTNRDPF